MNDTELENNFYQACLHHVYISDGNTYPSNIGFVSFSGTTITFWNHDNVSQPTDETLKTYTVQQAQDTWHSWRRNDYKTGIVNANINESQAINFIGPWSGNKLITIETSLTGNVVTLTIPQIDETGESNSSGIIAQDALPIIFRPTNKKTFVVST